VVDETFSGHQVDPHTGECEEIAVCREGGHTEVLAGCSQQCIGDKSGANVAAANEITKYRPARRVGFPQEPGIVRDGVDEREYVSWIFGIHFQSWIGDNANEGGGNVWPA